MYKPEGGPHLKDGAVDSFTTAKLNQYLNTKDKQRLAWKIWKVKGPMWGKWITLDNTHLLWLGRWWIAPIADIISSREANGPLHGLDSAAVVSVIQKWQ